MLHLEHYLTSYIAILDYRFELGRPKNNNTIKKVTTNLVGNLSIIVEHVHDRDFLISKKLGQVWVYSCLQFQVQI